MFAFRAFWSLVLLQSALAARIAKRRNDASIKDVGSMDAEVKTRGDVASLDIAETEAKEETVEDPAFAETVAEEAEQEAVGNSAGFPGLVRRRRRRRRARRRRSRRRTDRRRQVTSCAKDFAVVQSLNKCCKVSVSGQWTALRSIASSETLSISYGYFEDTQTFDLDATYRTSMATASAFFIYKGLMGEVSFSDHIASMVVNASYIRTMVNFNMTRTATYTNRDGRYLYEWVWTTVFGVDGNQACRSVPAARVGTSKTLQADTSPKCLPGFNSDPRYQTCLDGGQLP